MLDILIRNGWVADKITRNRSTRGYCGWQGPGRGAENSRSGWIHDGGGPAAKDEGGKVALWLQAGGPSRAPMYESVVGQSLTCAWWTCKSCGRTNVEQRLRDEGAPL